MRINFYDDPSQLFRAPTAMRINQLGLTAYPDGRRLAVTIEITPFSQRPSLELTVTNGDGAPAGSLTIIETLETQISFTLHLRDKQPADRYQVRADLYYVLPEEGRQVVDSQTAVVAVTPPSTQ